MSPKISRASISVPGRCTNERTTWTSPDRAAKCTSIPAASTSTGMMTEYYSSPGFQKAPWKIFMQYVPQRVVGARLSLCMLIISACAPPTLRTTSISQLGSLSHFYCCRVPSSNKALCAF